MSQLRRVVTHLGMRARADDTLSVHVLQDSSSTVEWSRARADRTRIRSFAVALIVLLELVSAAASNVGADRNARGVVSDESAGVLPGVTVVAAAADGRVLATTVTDGAGRYVIGPLAAGQVTLTFQLEGFSPATIRFSIGADADAVVNQRLVVAPQSETVVVVGKVPAPPPPPPPLPAPPRPAPRPKHVTISVPEHDPDSICGPAKLSGMAESFGTIRSRRTGANALYAKGDELVVEGGTLTGLQVGENFVVRRTYRIDWEPRTEAGEHTAGLVQIITADDNAAVAIVIYACDEIRPGDRLASFNPEPLRAAAPVGTPDYRSAARILFPDLGHMLGAPRRMMVIDRGAESGVRVGQRVTLFRRRLSGGNTPSVVGDAVVVAVRTDSATIRIERVTDAVFQGDLAAIQR
jgi:Carboxypeptidase regulatory-like domain